MVGQLLYTFLLTIIVGTLSAHAEVKMVKKDEKKSTSSKQAPSLDSETKRQPASTKSLTVPGATYYILESRDTGKVISFHDSSVEEVVESLRGVDVPVDKWHDCSSKNSEAGEPSLEDIETALNMSLLIESLANVPAPSLTDSQKDWVTKLSPCAPDLRLHLKALGLILTNFKLIQKPDA